MLGKLTLRKPLQELLQDQVQKNGMRIQSIDQQPVLELSTLPFHHRDPFDRLLIAQAKVAGWTIATQDRAFVDYAVPIIWT
jgi:PIN domain nuclease of toxin-antitoxin system